MSSFGEWPPKMLNRTTLAERSYPAISALLIETILMDLQRESGEQLKAWNSRFRLIRVSYALRLIGVKVKSFTHTLNESFKTIHFKSFTWRFHLKTQVQLAKCPRVPSKIHKLWRLQFSSTRTSGTAARTLRCCCRLLLWTSKVCNPQCLTRECPRSVAWPSISLIIFKAKPGLLGLPVKSKLKS